MQDKKIVAPYDKNIVDAYRDHCPFCSISGFFHSLFMFIVPALLVSGILFGLLDWLLVELFSIEQQTAVLIFGPIVSIVFFLVAFFMIKFHLRYCERLRIATANVYFGLSKED